MGLEAQTAEPFEGGGPADFGGRRPEDKQAIEQSRFGAGAQNTSHRAVPPRHPGGEGGAVGPSRAALSKWVGLWSGGWLHGRLRARPCLSRGLFERAARAMNSELKLYCIASSPMVTRPAACST